MTDQLLPPIIATSFRREEQIKAIAERLNRILHLNTLSPLFFEDLTQLLTLILEPESNKSKGVNHE